ncbi:hypothetical protein OUI59_20860 [Klebsiella variicola subsp. tropica]|uniref:hypothetical protein n=1 Tax=Klebsiella variicola TaxID=244366 RepID=UPI0022838F2F|nr:hypothetical protein [Klebsiella variicola]WAL51225.1 hypothetical protein OUI59_20860 [Klebsiella variicola subsp. tropica]
MTSKLTRERLEALANAEYCKSNPGAWLLGLKEVNELARMALAAMDSSESVELPLDYLQGHKDGLEWAAQLAEANHPETGDWLYDDPIELAKAIRKGPDMPPAQPVADSEPVAWTWQHLKQWRVTNDEERARDLAWDGVKVEPLYRHAQQPVVPDESYQQLSELYHAQEKRLFKIAQRIKGPSFDKYSHSPSQAIDVLEVAIFGDDEFCRAAMLAAAPQSPGSEPATVPGKWIPVSEQKPDCWCLTCRPVTLNDMRFVVCPDCGNKRCPRANNHRNACTGSNEPGQEGIAYPDTPQEVKGE